MKFFLFILFTLVGAIVVDGNGGNSKNNKNHKSPAHQPPHPPKTTTTHAPKTTHPPPEPCICEKWQKLATCITTTNNQTLDDWLIQHGVSDPAAFHQCAKAAIDTNPFPTSLLQALVIIKKVRMHTMKNNWREEYGGSLQLSIRAKFGEEAKNK